MNLPDFMPSVNTFDTKEARKTFFMEGKPHAFCVLWNDDNSRMLLFRTRGYEEEYTMNIENNDWHKAEEKEFEFSDKYDNYKIVIVAYVRDGEVEEEEWDIPYPYEKRPCSHCGDGGCIHCQPSWFI